MEQEFNASLFEKKLQTLKDSQESINSLSAWCLEHRQHHKKIVQAWLNVLKRVKVEHRLTLFYLANDVIQYSKRKNYEFVESWSTTLQKATTMVREEKVKHRVLRIFKIWEQRGIYGEEFLSDLSGLISVAPAKKSETEPLEFQPSYLIAKINACSRLEEDTDLKLKKMKENEQKLQWEDPEVVSSLKDRQRVEDVEKEIEDGIKLVEAVMSALNAEIKARKHLLNLLSQADNFYRTQRGEVKVVSNAYKNFGLRVKNLKKRLDEMLQDESRWSSPIPSPDINAPSPSPDSDIELPGQDDTNVNHSYLDQTYSANFYTPVSDQSNSFTNNGFTSFMGSNIPFDIHANLFNDSNTASHVSDTPAPSNNLIEVVSNQETSPTTQPQNSFSLNNIIKQLLPNPVPPATEIPQVAVPTNNMPYTTTPQAPLLPPPMPPFTSPPNTYTTNNVAYTDQSYPPMNDSYGSTNTSYQQMPPTYIPPPEVQPAYPMNADDYNPEEECETWENDGAWPEPPDMETPESPPGYEKEAVTEPVEYHDGVTNHGLLPSQEDVDHRVLLPPPHLPPHLADMKGPDTDHRPIRPANKDIDHRNLISLTGSPGPENNLTSAAVPAPPIPPPLWRNSDQDYRIPPQGKDQDYRNSINQTPMMQHFVNLAVDPPPPPPPPAPVPPNKHNNKRPVLRRPMEVPLTNQDNVESIDMELSDDDGSHIPKAVPLKEGINSQDCFDHSNKRPLIADIQPSNVPPKLNALESPPIPPSLEEDVDATASNIIETINQDDFFEGLPEMANTDGKKMNNFSEKNQNRPWYNNEWASNDQPQFNIPPSQQHADFQVRPPNPEFHPRPPHFPVPPQNFRGGILGHFPPGGRIDTFHNMPPPGDGGQSLHQNHFRGNRGGGGGRGWNKMHNNRGGNMRGGNRGFPRGRGNNYRGGRGRGGAGGGVGFREQW